MQYIVKIRGNDKPIQTTGDLTQIIAEWNKYIKTKADSIFQLNGNTYRVSAIQSIEKDTQTQKTETRAKKSGKELSEYKSERMAFLKLTPEEKSKRTGFAGLLYWGFTGNKLKENPEDQEKIIEIQKNFFEKNPKRMFINPSELKPMFKDRQLNQIVFGIAKDHIASDF